MNVNADDLFIGMDPDEGAETHKWTIKRAPARKSLVVACVSSVYFGIYTHFVSRRTMPCVRTGCKGCEGGMRREWHCYFLAQDLKDMRPYVIETTAGGAVPIRQHFLRYGTLRGVQVRLERADDRNNAPVVVTICGTFRKAQDLIEEESIANVLFRIWKVKVSGLIQSVALKPENLNEHERAAAVAACKANGYDDEWLEQRRKDLAGQLKMFQEEEDWQKQASNGRATG